jgi:ABC-type transport system involved in cytochrome bd biosynthesis fused ATPase/permease subunit
MFEALMKRAASSAEAQARARRRELAGRFAEALPPGVLAQAEEAGVALSGKGLRRRLALDSRLNQLIAGVIK